jgi:5-enolpyruvylshikimate-3-phosphate synthase
MFEPFFLSNYFSKYLSILFLLLLQSKFHSCKKHNYIELHSMKNFESINTEIIIDPILAFSGRISIHQNESSFLPPLILAAALNPFPTEVAIYDFDFKLNYKITNFANILIKAGAIIKVDQNKNIISITGGQFLDGLQLNCEEIPDIFPFLCVLGLFSNFNTDIFNYPKKNQENQIPHVDILFELNRMGSTIDISPKQIHFEGPQQINGTKLDNISDFSTISALIVAALYARSSSILRNFRKIDKKIVSFMHKLELLGAEFHYDINKGNEK